MKIRRVEPGDWAEWLRMRTTLWPDCPPEGHAREMQLAMSPSHPVFPSDTNRRGDGETGRQSEEIACFVAERPAGGLGGFVEVGLRKYADGCDSSPVGYLEGWYVDPELRQQGVGAALVRAGEEWARAQGRTEMASDCLLDNEVSLHAHLALGYAEAERLIHFKKRLHGPHNAQHVTGGTDASTPWSSQL
jgi:aminoglycoside 6'-N-acetyltransferase I